jgi:hypothetical protein
MLRPNRQHVAGTDTPVGGELAIEASLHEMPMSIPTPNGAATAGAVPAYGCPD